MFDLIIIGMGIGGITAGIYAKRANVNVLMIDKGTIGGLLNNIDTISNYPGLINISGPSFATELWKQVKDADIPYTLEEVKSLEIKDDKKIVITNKNKYEAKNVIIATGTKPKYLGLDNEKELLGRGLSTCALCDGNFYKGKDIAIVGGGNSALQESLYLSKIVNKVYILNRKDKFNGEEYLINKVENTSNIEIKYEVNIAKYNEENGHIKSITLDNTEEINISGVFIYIGYKPNTEIFSNLDIFNEDGHIIVNQDCESKIPGIYGVGDVIEKDIYQLVTAANDGLIAAMKISKSLE